MPGRIGVTGSSGKLGRAVVAELREHGYEVVGADRTAAAGTTDVVWDGRDVAALVAGFAGCDGLVHLAAIPSPGHHPDDELFANNTGATFAAFEAAARLGIRRVVQASSGSAYGMAWSPEPTYAQYVPLDEDHPMVNYDAYGLSKEVDERTGTRFARRYDMSVAALRFHWIATREEQLELVAEGGEGPAQIRQLWAYIDLRDAARACRLALEAAAERPYGFVPMNIVAADTLAHRPLGEMLAEVAPEIEVRADLGETGGGFAIERARQVIGWVPQHSWRDEEDLG